MKNLIEHEQKHVYHFKNWTNKHIIQNQSLIKYNIFGKKEYRKQSMCRRSLRVLRGPSCAAGCLIEKQREGGKTSSEEIEPRRDETLTEGEKMWAALLHSLLRRDAKDYLFVSLHAFSRARAAWCLAWPRALVIGFNVRMFKDDQACALWGGRRRPWDNERGYL